MTTKNARSKARRTKKKQTTQRTRLIQATVGALFLGIVGIAILQVRNSQLPDVDLSAIPDESIQYPDQLRSHDPDPEFVYNSNPPTSGPHRSAVPAGVYTREQADIDMIHNLEHGQIWFSYRDADDQEAISLLNEIQSSASSMVVVTHRSDNDSRVVAAAWRRLLEVEDLNRDELIAFLVRHVNKAPESVPG